MSNKFETLVSVNFRVDKGENNNGKYSTISW